MSVERSWPPPQRVGLNDIEVPSGTGVMETDLSRITWLVDSPSDLQPTPEEVEMEKAKEEAAIPPEPIPDAEGLPDDVRDGAVDPRPASDDDGSHHEHRGEPE